MEPPAKRVWQVLDTLGPVSSHLGLKNWDLCLARDAVIACPRSLWITVRAAAWAGAGSPNAMQRVWASSASPTGERALQDDGDTSWRRYLVRDLASITVRHCVAGANEIRIARHGAGSHVYALGDRDQTDRCREVLRTLYPEHYREESF